MEMFGDNLCAFTKRSWPTVKALAEHYGADDDLEILVHWFPVHLLPSSLVPCSPQPSAVWACCGVPCSCYSLLLALGGRAHPLGLLRPPSSSVPALPSS